mmetsp:Transcript_3380/g.4413  ORF Transcript_3380/g.4413 Transcript_3380/m.4413 type:complete len:369 (+) Transcript_3380:127-1233(+)
MDRTANSGFSENNRYSGTQRKSPLLLTQSQKDEMGNKMGPRRMVFGVKSNRKYYEQLKLMGPSLTTESQYLHNENYVGDWEGNLKHGFGTQTYGNGCKYEGEWRHGKREGKGTFWVKEKGRALRKQYAGDWVNDKREGNGVFLHADGGSYEGGWRANKRHGQGRMKYANGEVYEGEWQDDLRSGYGILRLENGDQFEGHWLGDKKEGPGKYLYFSTLKVYEGEWVDGSPKCGEYRSMDKHEVREGNIVDNGEGGFNLPSLTLKDPETILSDAITIVRQERAARFAAPGEQTRTFGADEVLELREKFQRYSDLNNKNFVPIGALRDLFEDVGGTYNEEELENLLWQLGADTDTEISFSEFIDLLALLWV